MGRPAPGRGAVRPARGRLLTWLRAEHPHPLWTQQREALCGACWLAYLVPCCRFGTLYGRPAPSPFLFSVPRGRDASGFLLFFRVSPGCWCGALPAEPRRRGQGREQSGPLSALGLHGVAGSGGLLQTATEPCRWDLAHETGE